MKVTVEPRDLSASKVQMRKKGLIPAMISSKTKNLPITISTREYEKAMMSHSPVLETSMGDMVIMKEIQTDPLSRKVIHISFQEISKGQTFHSKVSVQLTHEKTDFTQKGLIVKSVHSVVEIEATSESMVDHVTVDISHLDVHGTLKVKDLPKLKGIKYLDDAETLVAVVDYAAKTETEPEKATTESPATKTEPPAAKK